MLDTDHMLIDDEMTSDEDLETLRQQLSNNLADLDHLLLQTPIHLETLNGMVLDELNGELPKIDGGGQTIEGDDEESNDDAVLPPPAAPEEIIPPVQGIVVPPPAEDLPMPVLETDIAPMQTQNEEIAEEEAEIAIEAMASVGQKRKNSCTDGLLLGAYFKGRVVDEVDVEAPEDKNLKNEALEDDDEENDDEENDDEEETKLEPAAKSKSRGYADGLTKAKFFERMVIKVGRAPGAERLNAFEAAELRVLLRARDEKEGKPNVPETIKNHLKEFRARIRIVFKQLLPHRHPYVKEFFPLQVVIDVKEAEAERKAHKTPRVVDGNKLIELAIDGIRSGIKRNQVPQVLFCLAFLVDLRVIDLNTARQRAWTESASTATHVIGRRTKSGKEVIGTLINLLPSKMRFGVDPKDWQSSIVMICKPEFYPLVEEAIKFVLENGKKWDCSSSVQDYLNDKPCGAPRGTEWGSYNDENSVNYEMIKELRFNNCVKSWGSKKFKNWDMLSGRSFVTCMIQQGVLKRPEGLLPDEIVTLALSHSHNSGADKNYLKVDIQPPPVPVEGVILRATEDDPVVCDDGTEVSYGLYLERC